MKKYLKSLFNSDISLFIRKVTGIRAPIFLAETKEIFVASDLFVYRTDSGYSTIFRASNLVKKYYDVQSKLLLIFFDNSGKIMKEKELNFDSVMQEVIIDKEMLECEGIGTFLAMNICAEFTDQQIQIVNRCYIGYTKNSCYSMVHGNMIAIKTNNIFDHFKRDTDLKPAVTNKKSMRKYYLQKPNVSDKHMTLIFTNPLNRSMFVSVDKQKIKIKPRCCEMVNISHEAKVVEIISDFSWPRPIVISERHNFIDVHHG